jgi:hypothetical protein
VESVPPDAALMFRYLFAGWSGGLLLAVLVGGLGRARLSAGVGLLIAWLLTATVLLVTGPFVVDLHQACMARVAIEGSPGVAPADACGRGLAFIAATGWAPVFAVPLSAVGFSLGGLAAVLHERRRGR